LPRLTVLVNPGDRTEMATKFEDQRPVACMKSNSPWKTSKTYKVLDPHDPQTVLHEVYSVTPEEAIEAVEVASKAFTTWKDSAIAQRQQIFRKAAQLLRERSQEYAAIEQAETTSSPIWSGFEMGLAVENLEETASAINYLRGETYNTAGQRATIERHPYGVVLGITPWNAPMTLGLRAVTNAIMTGNCVVLKTSEYSPRVHSLIASLFVEAGLPEGVLSVLNIAPEDAPAVVEAIIAHPAVRKANFTGSTAVGTKIAQVCAKYLKPCTLELGGKASLIVLEGADLEFAVNSAAFGAFFHSGQICMSTNNVLAHVSIAEELEAAILKKRKELSAGKSDAPLRGLFAPTSAKRVQALIDDAKSKGATVHGPEDGSAADHNIIQPHVLTGVKEGMNAFTDEHFGPLMSIIRFSTDEEAVALANSSDYGLAAAVYSKDEAHAMRIARQIEAGMVHINGSTVHDTQTLPHGGIKKSGYGRFNGIYGLQEFTWIKVITVNEPHPYPI